MDNSSSQNLPLYSRQKLTDETHRRKINLIVWAMILVATIMIATISKRSLGNEVAELLPTPVKEIKPVIIYPCELTEVYDGDTITVNLTLAVRVRLLDCWAPELNKGPEESRWFAGKSRDNIKKLEGSKGFIEIPIGTSERVDDVFTFGRVLAYVKLADESGKLIDLSEYQVLKGFAHKTKAELEDTK